MSYEFINDYIGAPFKTNGRGPEFDCYGLLVDVFKKHKGIELPDWQASNDTPSAAFAALSAGLAEQLAFDRAVKIAEPYQDWDIALLNRRQYCGHVGVLLSGGVLHTSKQTNGCVFTTVEKFHQMMPSRLDVYRWHE